MLNVRQVNAMLTFLSPTAAVEPMAFRLKTANRSDCISTFIRGDADVLLCHETPEDPKLPFDDSFIRMTWGADRLILAVGGAPTQAVRSDEAPPERMPLISYPEYEYFGQLLQRSANSYNAFDTRFSTICESAFSGGMREMALKGIGLAWMPISIIQRENEAGKLINLFKIYESIPLTISPYTRPGPNLSVDQVALTMTLRLLPQVMVGLRGGIRYCSPNKQKLLAEFIWHSARRINLQVGLSR